MADYRITYWKAVPSQIEVFNGTERIRQALSARFQELIDAAAMRYGLIGTDAYLESWRVGPVLSREGPPVEVAAAIAAEIEAQFEEIRDSTLGGGSGP